MLFKSILLNLTLLNFASRIRSQCCLLHTLKSEVFIRGGGGEGGELGPVFLNFLDPPLYSILILVPLRLFRLVF